MGLYRRQQIRKVIVVDVVPTVRHLGEATVWHRPCVPLGHFTPVERPTLIVGWLAYQVALPV